VKVLMIGLGSIGQRHLRNISRLYKDVQFIAYRKRGLTHAFSDNMKIQEQVNVEGEYHIQSYYNLDDALSQKPDAAFITNITSEHIVSAIKAAEQGCDLFIEKPLSHTMNGVNRLKQIINEKNSIVFMGFQYRSHPGLILLKSILSNPEIGDVLSVEAATGERLTTMHTYEDYRNTYMAKKEYGGGVILNSLIHEIDYLRWIFGELSHIYSIGGKLSSMEIDVEDTVESLLTASRNGKTIPVRLHGDLLQYPPCRYCKIICDHGKVYVDLIRNNVEWYINDEAYTKSFSEFTRNDMFIAEIMEFFSAVGNRARPSITIDDGISNLRMALEIKDSAQKG